MIPTLFQGESVYLCPYPPDAKKVIALTFRVFADVLDSLQGVEARRSLSRTVRTEMQCRLLLFEAECVAFRSALRGLENKRVLMPFWPAEHAYHTGESPVSSGIWLIAEPDISEYEISLSPEASTFEPSADATRVPLMLGVFTDAPNPSAMTTEVLEVDIKFRETSAATFSLQPLNVTGAINGPAVPGHAPKLFPIVADWSKYPTAGKAEVKIARTEIGFGRQPLEVYYPQRSSRQLTTQLGMNVGEFAEFMQFFIDRRGPVENFWVPGVYSDLTLTQPTALNSSLIYVETVEHVSVGDFLIFTTEDGAAVMRKIASIDVDKKTIDLSVSPGAFQPNSVRIASLILARFKKEEFSVEVDGPTFDAKVDFVETPDEYAPPESEEIGVTMGAQPTKAYLYRFTQYFPDSTVVHRFTSHERDVTVSGQTFSAQNGLFEHGDITDSLESDQTSVKLTSRAFVGNPLMLFMPFRLEVPLWLEVFECEPDVNGNAAASTSLWFGRATKPNFSGPKIKFESVHRLQSLNTNVPCAMVGPNCSKKLYSAACGVQEGDWTFSGLVVSYVANPATLTISTLTRNGEAAAALAAGYFNLGRVYGGAGIGYYARSVFGSSEYNGGNVTITLSTALDLVPAVGSVVKIVRACKHTPDACTSFSNFNRFGGHLFVPNGNPSLVPVKKTSGGGKK